MLLIEEEKKHKSSVPDKNNLDFGSGSLEFSFKIIFESIFQNIGYGSYTLGFRLFHKDSKICQYLDMNRFNMCVEAVLKENID